MVLIGIIGKIGSGKTTVTNHLVSKYLFKEYAMALPLKNACKELFRLSDEQLNGSLEQKEEPDPRWFGASPRKILQFVGTDLLRNQIDTIMPGLGQDIFVNSFKLWYNEQRIGTHVVVSDVRFQNETDIIRKLGGYLIKLERPDIDDTSDHSSETGVDNILDYNMIIYNDSSIEDLLKKVDDKLCTNTVV